MKNLFILIVVFFPLFVSAQQIPNIRGVSCFTKSFLTTSINLNLLEKDKYKLMVTHHNGVDYAPIHRGTVTTKDIKHLEKKSEVFTSLGKKYIINFDKDECKKKDNYFICYTANKKNLNNDNIKNYSLRLYSESIDSYYGEFNYWLAHFDVMVEGDNLVYSSAMTYQIPDCHFALPQ